MWTARRVILIFLVGAISGTLLDQIHTRFAVLTYAHPVLFGQGWWVAPNFGVGAIAIFAGAVPFARRLNARGVTIPSHAFLVGGACFVGAYFATGLFDSSPNLCALGLLAALIARIALDRDRFELSVFSLILGVGGMAYEAMLTTLTGAYRFVHPTAINVPMWLPMLYMHGGPLAIRIVQRLAGA